MSLSYRDDGEPLANRPPRPELLSLSLSLLLILTILCGEAAGAGWEIDPSITFGADYQSNPRYRIESDNEESATGFAFDARIPMLVRTERTNASMAPRMRRHFYRKEINADLEDEDYYIPMSIGHSTMLQNFGANLGWSSLSLRTSELNDAGSGNPRSLLQEQQKNLYFSPYWSYQFTPKNSFRLNGGYSEFGYSPPSISRFDFTSENLSASFVRSINYRNSFTFQANLSKFDSSQPVQNISNDSTSNGLSFIFSNSLSETLSFTANLGWARTQSTVTTQVPPIDFPLIGPVCLPNFSPAPCDPIITKADSTNFVGDLSLLKRSELLDYGVSIGQTITPNSNGSEVIRRTLRGNVNRRFSRNFSFGLNFLIFEQKDVGDLTRRERVYTTSSAILRWAVSPQWTVTSRYRYVLSDNQNNLIVRNGTAQNHGLFLGLHYNSPGWGNR